LWAPESISNGFSLFKKAPKHRHFKNKKKRFVGKIGRIIPRGGRVLRTPENEILLLKNSKLGPEGTLLSRRGGGFFNYPNCLVVIKERKKGYSVHGTY